MNTRPAEIGDVGIVLGLERYGSISGLLLQTEEGEQAHLWGDARMVEAIVDALLGERVEVVEAEGSVYGAHGICPLDAAPCWTGPVFVPIACAHDHVNIRQSPPSPS